MQSFVIFIMCSLLLLRLLFLLLYNFGNSCSRETYTYAHMPAYIAEIERESLFFLYICHHHYPVYDEKEKSNDVDVMRMGYPCKEYIYLLVYNRIPMGKYYTRPARQPNSCHPLALHMSKTYKSRLIEDL